jgi:hypothetical protein
MVGWEMLSGQRPWAGESLYSVIYRQKHDPLPALDSIRPDLPQRLQYLVEGLMPKHPEERWPSAARFLALLTTDDKLPGFREWQAGLKRRRKGGGRVRTGEMHAVSPASSTVHFRRDETPNGSVPVSRNQQSLTPVGELADESLATPSPWDQSVNLPPEEAPAKRGRGLLVGAGILALAAVAALTLLRPQRQPDAGLITSAEPLGDARGVEVPVLPPVDTAGLVEAVAAAGVTAPGSQLDSAAQRDATVGQRDTTATAGERRDTMRARRGVVPGERAIAGEVVSNTARPSVSVTYRSTCRDEDRRHACTVDRATPAPPSVTSRWSAVGERWRAPLVHPRR